MHELGFVSKGVFTFPFPVDDFVRTGSNNGIVVVFSKKDVYTLWP